MDKTNPQTEKAKSNEAQAKPQPVRKKFVLPTQPTKAALLEPDRVIFMGKPKCGKTTSLALLPNALDINFEDAKQTATGMFQYISNINDLKILCRDIREAGKPYHFGIIDTVTKMEELAVEEAERIYMTLAVGKNWIKKKKTKDGRIILDPECGKAQYGNILQIPKGSGYQYLTTAMKNIDKMLKETFPVVIYNAHIKETQLKNEETGIETTSIDVNLTGKNKQIFSADAHAIGYFERIGNKLYLKFTPSEDLISGCKIDRIADKTFLISEKTDKGIVTYWENIFPSIKK